MCIYIHKRKEKEKFSKIFFLRNKHGWKNKITKLNMYREIRLHKYT